ncbi:hypothetical protein BDZ97DRAFT_1913886 [Flammula alnicola]|nr:hypothetical protein BDZ97DRAFT_1913886 [Flammula alnicola]
MTTKSQSIPPTRKRKPVLYNESELTAENLAHSDEVEPQSAEIAKEDEEIEKEANRRDEDDQDYINSSQPSSDFSSSQSSDTQITYRRRSDSGDEAEGVTRRVRVDPNADYVDSGGSSSSSSDSESELESETSQTSTNSDSSQQSSDDEEEPEGAKTPVRLEEPEAGKTPQRAKTPLFLPSSSSPEIPLIPRKSPSSAFIGFLMMTISFAQAIVIGHRKARINCCLREVFPSRLNPIPKCEPFF